MLKQDIRDIHDLTHLQNISRSKFRPTHVSQEKIQFIFSEKAESGSKAKNQCVCLIFMNRTEFFSPIFSLVCSNVNINNKHLFYDAYIFIKDESMNI